MVIDDLLESIFGIGEACETVVEVVEVIADASSSPSPETRENHDNLPPGQPPQDGAGE